MSRNCSKTAPSKLSRVSVNDMVCNIIIIGCLLTTNLAAQSGEDGLNQAIDKVNSYFQLGVNLMYAIGSVVGLVGAVKVFNKWNSGDQDTSKVAASWFGSCIFLIVVAAILDGFFIA